MVCIYCGSPTSVVNSRHQRRNNAIWRRRKCSVCGSIFTSIERAELDAALRVESPAGLHAFDRDRLFISIYESCRHRPAAMSEAKNLTQQVINRLLAEPKTPGLVTRQQLIKATYQVLHSFDKAAATVFAAYHPTDEITS